MSLVESLSKSGDVRVLWDLSGLRSVAAEVYQRGISEAESRSASENYAALDFVDFGLMGDLQITRGNLGLFRPSPGSVAAREMPVLRALLGLREAVLLAAKVGPQTMHCHDEWWVTARREGEMIRLTGSSSLMARQDEWIEPLDDALSQIRGWLEDYVPLLRTDAVLGAWLRGGSLPEFYGPLPQSGLII